MRISDWSSDVCSSDLQSSKIVVYIIGAQHFIGTSVLIERTHEYDMALPVPVLFTRTQTGGKTGTACPIFVLNYRNLQFSRTVHRTRGQPENRPPCYTVRYFVSCHSACTCQGSKGGRVVGCPLRQYRSPGIGTSCTHGLPRRAFKALFQYT